MKAAGGDWLKTACITVLGSGFAPYASGSWGSLTSILIYALSARILREFSVAQIGLEILTVGGILGACVLSVRWGAWAIERFGSKDPKPFVLDEFAGQWVALLLMPAATTSLGFLCFLFGQLFLFRVMDVLKPPPARQLERLPAGWGVLCDDLMAGIYANLLGQVLWRWTPLVVWLAA